MVSFQSRSGPDDPEPEEDPLDPRVAMSDWDRRFLAWRDEVMREARARDEIARQEERAARKDKDAN